MTQKFIAKLEEGFDVVNGWKVRRLDPWHKVYPSKVFNWMIPTSVSKLHFFSACARCQSKQLMAQADTKDRNIRGDNFFNRFDCIVTGFRVTGTV